MAPRATSKKSRRGTERGEHPDVQGADDVGRDLDEGHRLHAADGAGVARPERAAFEEHVHDLVRAEHEHERDGHGGGDDDPEPGANGLPEAREVAPRDLLTEVRSHRRPDGQRPDGDGEGHEPAPEMQGGDAAATEARGHHVVDQRGGSDHEEGGREGQRAREDLPSQATDLGRGTRRRGVAAPPFGHADHHGLAEVAEDGGDRQHRRRATGHGQHAHGDTDRHRPRCQRRHSEAATRVEDLAGHPRHPAQRDDERGHPEQPGRQVRGGRIEPRPGGAGEPRGTERDDGADRDEERERPPRHRPPEGLGAGRVVLRAQARLDGNQGLTDRPADHAGQRHRREQRDVPGVEVGGHPEAAGHHHLLEDGGQLGDGPEDGDGAHRAQDAAVGRTGGPALRRSARRDGGRPARGRVPLHRHADTPTSREGVSARPEPT